ncbi:hypothetical protein B5M09_012799 [Aphanomyces astaci]|uniref:Uncharacterized protein n=1 Tax=Aphanomyces astaci TaxID=112090 RepID=A0A425D865_APHAT|nr:hypothetical protein B5M09_012799 [Aphanomyces astaci]
MYGDAHGVGYLLDPRFVDSGFDSMEFKEGVVDFVVNCLPSVTAPSTNIRRDSLSHDLKEFPKYCLKLHSAKGWRLEELKSKKKIFAELSLSAMTKLMYIKTNYNLDDEVGGKEYSSDKYTNSE